MKRTLTTAALLLVACAAQTASACNPEINPDYLSITIIVGEEKTFQLMS